MKDRTLNLSLCAVTVIAILILLFMLYRKKDSYGFAGIGNGYGSLGHLPHISRKYYNPQNQEEVRKSRYEQIKNLANNQFHGYDEIKSVRHSVTIDSNKYERDDNDPSEDTVTQTRYRRKPRRIS